NKSYFEPLTDAAKNLLIEECIVLLNLLIQFADTNGTNLLEHLTLIANHQTSPVVRHIQSQADKRMGGSDKYQQARCNVIQDLVLSDEDHTTDPLRQNYQNSVLKHLKEQNTRWRKSRSQSTEEDWVLVDDVDTV